MLLHENNRQTVQQAVLGDRVMPDTRKELSAVSPLPMVSVTAGLEALLPVGILVRPGRECLRGAAFDISGVWIFSQPVYIPHLIVP